MELRFSKERLHPGESYPLKRGDLDVILSPVTEGLVGEIAYRRATAALMQAMDVGPHFPTLRAHYVGVEDQWPYQDMRAGEVILTMRSVRSSESSAAARLLRVASKELVEWLTGLASRNPTWQSEPHQFDLFFADGAVGVREDDEIRYPVVAGQ